MADNNVTHQKLIEFEAGTEAPHFFIVEDNIYVQIEWICDRMGYTNRGEARTTWRRDSKFAVSSKDGQLRYIEGNLAMKRLARATIFGQNGDSAKEELAALHGQLSYVACQHGLEIDLLPMHVVY